MTFRSFSLVFIWIAAILLVLGGCSGGGSSSDDDGTLTMFLTDRPDEDFSAVYVTIDEVQVHAANDGTAGEEPEAGASAGWQVAASPGKTYNLLELVNGVMAELGTTELESGHYTQIRLLLGEQADKGTNVNGESHEYPNYIIDDSGKVHELTVPSGLKSGIKLVHGFDMTAGLTAELVLDFDASKSVVQTGKSGKYLLKPTIKVIDTINNAIVTGTVRDAEGNPIEGGAVSAQVVDSLAAEIRDRATVFTSTLSDETGGYQLYLPPGDYTVSAFKTDGATAYGPDCDTVTTELDMSYGVDFQLAAGNTGSIRVSVATDATVDTTVDISVRQSGLCGNTEAIIVTDKTVLHESADTAQSGDVIERTYDVAVPGGVTYTVVAWADATTMSRSVDVSAGLISPVSLDFTTSP